MLRNNRRPQDLTGNTMNIPLTQEEIQTFVFALMMTQARILPMFIVLPLFNSQILPGMLRFGLAAGFGLIAVPVLVPQMPAIADLSPALLLPLLLKEAFIGFVLGYVASVPFWIFEAVGFFVDNQRGASIASTLNPLTGNNSSPLGILFNQAYIVFFLLAGGFVLLLGVLYDSFAIWSPLQWSPHLTTESAILMLELLDRLVRMAFLLAAPALLAMFLSELGLALVSLFVPQFQVFFIAIPIKSALAVLVMILYASILFQHGAGLVESTNTIMPFLRGQWEVFPVRP